MKKTTAFLLALCLCIGLCACGGAAPDSEAPGESSAELAGDTPTETMLPKITMVINRDPDDTTTHIKAFPPIKDADQLTAYAHYYVSSENKTEKIRMKLENQWGLDEMVKEDFTVESDKLVTVQTNTWLTYDFTVYASNLYFYRLTMYYGETDQVLATRTIYTPYENSYYSESDFSDTPPVFRAPDTLNEEEQAFFDLCQYALVDYGKKNQIKGAGSFGAWQGSSHLYIQAELKSPDGYQTVVFAIRNDNPEDYMAEVNGWDLFPDEEDTPPVLEDYYYVRHALLSAIVDAGMPQA